MAIGSALAIYFIIWWVTLFALLPVGLRTQADEDDITLGTTASAPARPHVGRAFLRTTIVSAVIFAAFYYLTQVAGFGLDDIPHFFPDLQ
jgi:predicted secreted protein